MSEVAEIVRLQRVLVLRGAAAAADAEILHGLEIKNSAGNLGSGFADAGNDFVGANLAFAERLELAKHRALCCRRCRRP